MIGVVPSDASVLQRLGEMYDQEGDKSLAFQYHYDVSRWLSSTTGTTCMTNPLTDHI